MDDFNQLEESNLLDVFNQLKGDDAKHRPFIDFNAFKAAVLRYKPECF